MHAAEALLMAHGKTAILDHSRAVAAQIVRIAVQHQLPAEPCRVAALCHDIGGITPPEDMLAAARAAGWWMDAAEERHPFLLHQRHGAALCADMLHITDPRVLSAVGCHTTLKVEASAIDMALYISDKIAWDQPGEPPYLRTVQDALAQSLPRGCLAHMDYTLSHGMILMPHQWFSEAHAWLRGICEQ